MTTTTTTEAKKLTQRQIKQGFAPKVSHAKPPAPPQVISEIHLIPLDRIQVKAQPRTEFDDVTITELAKNIEQHGLLQPVLVNPTGDEKYQLICGERRMRAVQLLNQQAIPALITKMDAKTITTTQLAENIQREDMSLKDTANAIRKLFDLHGSLEAVSLIVNKSKPWVSKRLAVTHPDLGIRSRRLLEDCVCEDIELLSTFSQIENLHDYAAINEAETLIRTKNMNRQQARDYLKATKDKIAKQSAADEDKRKKQAEAREAKAKQPPRLDPVYEMRYGIHEMVTDEEIPSVSALLSGFTPQECVTIEELLKPAYEAGTQSMDDLANEFLKATLSGDYKPLELTAWLTGALGHPLSIVDVTHRLWNCEPDNKARWEKG